MKSEEHVWAIVSTPGVMSRVRALTRAQDGEFVSKQFWALDGRESLLERTLRRVERIHQSGWFDVGVPERWTRFLNVRAAPA